MDHVVRPNNIKTTTIIIMNLIKLAIIKSTIKGSTT